MRLKSALMNSMRKEGRNGYIVVSRGDELGLYVASFNLGTDYHCHKDLVKDYADGSWEGVRSSGSVSFNKGYVDISSGFTSTDFDEFLNWEDYKALEDEMLRNIDEIDIKGSVENVRWF